MLRTWCPDSPGIAVSDKPTEEHNKPHPRMHCLAQLHANAPQTRLGTTQTALPSPSHTVRHAASHRQPINPRQPAEANPDAIVPTLSDEPASQSRIPPFSHYLNNRSLPLLYSRSYYPEQPEFAGHQPVTPSARSRFARRRERRIGVQAGRRGAKQAKSGGIHPGRG
ncbi:hypothetical protein N7532_000963 [Penicillium argentinense]|uniref:Uncharacterized protein n=1 Tax=Penicillium argentinense TaxID=1131581 RepID=A0A9W9KM00_9EURO|nr:uncharacterized protein N7532_000963 [Penicillium argentinense]KAJ5110428.1 hypothetical protein N7532_000963 [Penicillium argentinense]